jgi:hypothetical protein
VIWQGQVAGVDAALNTFKADKAYPMRKLHEVNHLSSILSYTLEPFSSISLLVACSQGCQFKIFFPGQIIISVL